MTNYLVILLGPSAIIAMLLTEYLHSQIGK